MSNENLKPARPWDLFNKNLEKVQAEVAEKRLEICNSCPEFIRTTSQCKKCGCLMNFKTKIPNASCPIGKWGIERVTYKEEK